MFKDKKKQREWDEAYKKENTRLMSVRLHNVHDADILDAISKGKTRQGELMRLARLGIEYERLQKEGQPLPQEKPMPLRPVEKKKGMIDLRKVVRGTVDNPGSVPDPE